MEEALGNSVILQEIGECLPFEDLKNARIVNRFWNRILNLVFRKRSMIDAGLISTRDEFIQKESAFEHQELVAIVPLKICLDSIADQKSLFSSLVIKSTWLLRVKQMQLYRYWTAEELNRMIPFMLHNLPCLQKLDVQMDASDPSKTPMGDFIPDVPADAEFSITCFKADFNGDDFKTPLDPTFLRQCKKLKKFKASVVDSDTAILDFLKMWKKVYVPSMRYNYISFILLVSTHNDEKLFCEAIFEFVNMSKPKKLRLEGFECLEFGFKNSLVQHEPSYNWTAAMTPKLQDPSVRSLVSTFPATLYGDDRAVHPDWALLQLKKCKAFAKVTELVLKPDDRDWFWFDPTECQAAQVTHNFEQVESLVICEQYPCHDCLLPIIPHDLFGSFCGKIAPHLRNLTKLTIKGIHLDDDDTFDEIFKELNQFGALRELCFCIYHLASALELILAVKGNRHGRGYFESLSVLSGLNKFRLLLPVQEVPRSYMFILFSGYAPHVSLELEIYDFVVIKAERRRRASLQLTKDQFKEVLQTVEAYWANPCLCIV